MVHDGKGAFAGGERAERERDRERRGGPGEPALPADWSSRSARPTGFLDRPRSRRRGSRPNASIMPLLVKIQLNYLPAWK
jgi:hypothetical protein